MDADPAAMSASPQNDEGEERNSAHSLHAREAARRKFSSSSEWRPAGKVNTTLAMFRRRSARGAFALLRRHSGEFICLKDCSSSSTIVQTIDATRG
jgi:hypothetical protein